MKEPLQVLSSVPGKLSNLVTTPLSVLHPRLIYDVLFKKNKRLELFLNLSAQKKLILLRSVTLSVRKDLLQKVPDNELVALLHNVDPDEATDMLQLLKPKRREKILEQVSQELKSSLSTLLQFDAETAAGLMTLDYITASDTATISEVAKSVQEHESRTGRPPVILVMKSDGKLAGFLPSFELGVNKSSEKIAELIKRIPSISYAATHKQVIQLFRMHPHSKVVVKNDANNIIGIIYSDDVLNLLQKQQASSLYDFAGIRQEESVTDSTRQKVHNRYKWLIINVFTAFLAAFTVSRFSDVLSKYVILAAYMPIVAGLGGNASMQTFAVMVRGISLGQIRLGTAWRTLRSELGAGVLNGMIISAIVASIAIFLNKDPRLGIVLAIAMVINLFVAAFFGTLTPLIMAKLGKDPATSASIFITMTTDTLGFLVFLSLASIILPA